MNPILIVEDEPAIGRVLTAYINKAGYPVELVADGDRALEAFSRLSPSLVLLDVMLPKRSGWDVLQAIRQAGSCPVIMLTALGDVQEIITALNRGADDCITKPFNPGEVVARIHAVLRRSTQFLTTPDSAHFGSLKVDFTGHTLWLQGKEVLLTPRDLALFLFMARHPNQTFTRRQLIEQVWGPDYAGSDRAVDLAVKRLRKNLENWPAAEGAIRTFRGLGYQLSVYEQ
ncbi:response regulator transcription factor [Heliophilum fasciatum]|uniref:Stage 0 sporulation protein A homolog n=1 Tax=Heliophilum fasciatum TaxID=35700 RepID=A0A4R2RXV9_9FIRM|nr:response regulator transcription factor [Heliophilum fasciatum]MCW2278224.1 DNA-binding response OmpR family regulator [Heliophilum fasciatum]TCP63955.1 DNA-binding response OmpR family regulator [Heliophilum fasciatum]